MAAPFPISSSDYGGTLITVDASGKLNVEPAPSVHTDKLPGFLVKFAGEKQRRIANFGSDMSLGDVMVRSGCRFEPWGADTAEARASGKRLQAMEATSTFVSEFLPSIHAFHHQDATLEQNVKWARELSRPRGDAVQAVDATKLPAQTLYAAIQHSAIVRFVAVHSVYFTRSTSAAIACLVDQIEGSDNTGLVTRAPLDVELPSGREEPVTNPYVAFVCTPDAGIGAVVQDALAELYILAVGGDTDKETDFRRVVHVVSDALCLYGTEPNEGKVPLRWDAIHTLGFAIDVIPEGSPLYAVKQTLGDFLSFLSPVQDELAQSA